MATANNTNAHIYLASERVSLGHSFLRFSVTLLMFISISAPVVRLGSDFWIKLDQLLLPFVVVIYFWLLLAGLAQPIRLNALFGVSLAFCVCIAVSMLWGTQVIGHPLLSRDFFELIKPAFPLLFFTIAYEANFSETSLRALAKYLGPVVLLICVYAFGQWFSLGFTAYLQPYYTGGLHDDGGLSHYRRVYSTLSNPNFLGMLMTWVIAAFTLAALFQIGSRFWNILWLLLSLVTLTMTGSRYGLIDTALAFLLIFLLPTPTQRSKRARGVFFLILVPGILAAILAVAASNTATLRRFQQLMNPLQENSLRLRLDGLWKDAVGQFLASPFVGHGPAKVIFSNVYTDSEYLQILKQYGIIGLLPYLGYFLFPLAMVWRGLRAVTVAGPRLEKDLPATYWAVCVSFVLIVTALFMNVGMGTYYNFSLVAFLWIWMGIGASCAKRITAMPEVRDRLLKS